MFTEILLRYVFPSCRPLTYPLRKQFSNEQWHILFFMKRLMMIKTTETRSVVTYK
jgi:hypothetical protein